MTLVNTVFPAFVLPALLALPIARNNILLITDIITGAMSLGRKGVV